MTQLLFKYYFGKLGGWVNTGPVWAGYIVTCRKSSRKWLKIGTVPISKINNEGTVLCLKNTK